MVHSDRFRVVGPSEIREGRVSWLRARDRRDVVVEALNRFEKRVTRKSMTTEHFEAIAEPESGAEEESPGSSSSEGGSEEARKRLKRPKAELEVAKRKLSKKERKKATAKKARERRRPSGEEKKTKRREKRQRSPSSEVKADKKIAKEKKKRRAQKSSKSGSLDSVSDEELFQSARPGKSGDHKPGMDRGPFGGGPPL